MQFRKHCLGLASIVVLAIALVASTSAQGGPPPPPTNVLYGFVTSNRTLTYATPGPMYYIPGDLVVNPGVTLSVEPGVSLLFPAGKDTLQGGDYPGLSELIIQGTLSAVGTPGSPITFGATAGGAGQWGQLRVLAGGSLQMRRVYLSGAATAIKDDGALDVSQFTATALQNGAVVNAGATGHLYDSKFVGVGGGIGLLLSQAGITAVPDSSNPQPCDVSAFNIGVQVQMSTISNIVSHDNATGCLINANGVTLSYLTLARNSQDGIRVPSAPYYIYSSIITGNGNCGACFSSSGGFTNYVDSWTNVTNFYGPGSIGPLTASFNPLYVDNAGSDFHLSSGSPFKTYGPWGAEIGAYGPGPGSPVPAHLSSWGKVKATYR